MRAIRVHKQGGPEVLQFEDLPDLIAAPGQAVVGIQAFSLNHLDIWLRAGQPGRVVNLPLTPGADMAGTVLSVGPGSDDSLVGSRVAVYPGLGNDRRAPWFAGDESFSPGFGVLSGAYAQQAAVPIVNLVRLPDSVDWVNAAAFPVTFTTAWHMLAGRASVRPGMTVLVHGAGAGVGSAALQIARLHGAAVIATAGSDAKIQQALEQGADHGINYQSEKFADRVLDITNGRGVDIVVDHIGGETLKESLRCLATGGTLVNCGVTAGSEVTLDFRTIYPRQLSILGSMLGSKAEMELVARFIGEGKLRPVIDRVMPWTEIQEAHRLMDDRQVYGKIVLTVS